MSGQTLTVEIEVPKKELTLLGETLRLSRHRQKDPVKFIQRETLTSMKANASSTVDVRDWRQLDKKARELGLTPVFLKDWRGIPDR